MLVERGRGDAVRKPFHDQRAVRHRREDEVRDARVVAKQIALGQLQLRPEHLVQVGDLQMFAVGEIEDAVPPRLFERIELVDDGGGIQCLRRSACGVRGRSCIVGRATPGLRGSRRGALRVGHTRLRSRFHHGVSRRGRMPRQLLLAANVAGLLVVAQPEVDRVAQLGVGGPLGELDLGDELRPDPVRVFVRLRGGLERAGLRLERPEQLHHAPQLALVEPGAGVAGVDEVLAARRRRGAARRSRCGSAAARSSRRSRTPAR